MTTMNRQLTNRQSIEQRRAARAWEHITEIEVNESSDTQGKYGTLVRGLAAMIQVNGLATTAAFIHAKAKPEFDKLYSHLDRWLKEQIKYTQPDLLDFIRAAGADQYRRATAEAIEYANWLKRYVEAKGWKSSEGQQP